STPTPPFDAADSRLPFPIGSLARIPSRIRVTAAVQLFDDSGSGRLLGADPPPDPLDFSDRLTPPVVAPGCPPPRPDGRFRLALAGGPRRAGATGRGAGRAARGAPRAGRHRRRRGARGGGPGGRD